MMYQEYIIVLVLSVMFQVSTSDWLTSNDVAIQGQSFTLVCSYWVNQMYWYIHGNEYIGYSNKVNSSKCQFDKTRYSYIYEFKKCGSQHTLTIKSINYERDNDVKWECGYNQYYDAYTIQVKVGLTSDNEAIHGKRFTLICSTLINPMYWYINGDYIGSSNKRNSNHCDFDSSVYSSIYEFNNCGYQHSLTIKDIDYNRDNDVVWKCSNNYYAEYKIQVKVPVTSVALTVPGFDVINESLRVIEGDTLEIICETEFAVPKPTIQLLAVSDINFTESDINMIENDVYQSKFTTRVSVEMDEMNITCSAFNGFSQVTSDITILHVSYSPRLTIINTPNTNNQSTLNCVAYGRPEHITFSPWKHYLNDMVIREVKGYMINSTVYGLPVSTDVDSDDGIYICTASNGIINKETGDLHQTTSIQFNTTAKPIFYVDNSDTIMATMGETVTINVTFTSIEKSDIVWHHSSVLVNETERVHILQHDINVTHPYSQSIIIPATNTVLLIESVTPTDTGTYECRVCNSNGCSESSFELQIADTDRIVAQASGDSQLTIGIAAGVAVLVLVTITAVIICVIFKRRRQQTPKEEAVRKYTSGEYVTTNGTVSAENQHSMEPIITENDLYISADIPITPQNNIDNYTQLNNVNSREPQNHGDQKPDIVYYNTATDCVQYNNVQINPDDNTVEIDPYINLASITNKINTNYDNVEKDYVNI